MPVGVISSSARMMPMKAAAQPSLRPAKIIGLAAGRMMSRMLWLRVARKDRPISSSDFGVLRTAPRVFSTMTGIAMMQTVMILAVRPMP